MSKVIIIGAGGVGGVVTHKCAQLPDVFPEIILASRNEEKCKKIAAQLSRPIRTAQVDADNVEQLTELLKKEKPSLVINVALPYQDLHIMDACLNAGVHYLDTANYEPPEVAKFEYKWQWAYQDKFQKAGLMALLGSGFDPGVTNVYTAYIKKHCLDEIHELDIIDANAGNHGQPFATNFNPEINIREVTAKGRYWQNGEWVETDPLSVKDTFDFPEGIGPMDIYLMYHEELESIVKHFPEIKRARFWMTFSQNYLKHLEVLQNVGMTSIEPVLYNGVEVIPLQFLKSVLPDPSSLGPLTKGRTCIGCVAKGIKDGKEKIVYIYNICDHEECYREVQSQAISYTTGVPAMIGAKMMLENKWMKPGVWNMEQFDPDPFMEDLNKYGLPWTLVEKSDTGLSV
ncbi:saccharopine dehydrogenase family protein [Saccharophagus sp. K07]|uniref:saccharopine dehydrogenase family protein n=1 Tax=Saccharophagus sp. K07 TaxID=2283636 RepID=UPI0016521C5E|nr:saccharopine dehydrogenase family protein [Saccharophagus sp. K07]MBC6906965.1 saccharopine dehydrogenase family protein [Saccharophagus sp. K07]